LRILRSPAETPGFENLLIPTGTAEVGPGQAVGLPDPFAGASPELSRPIEHRVDQSNPFPDRPLAPFRSYWRESTFLRAVGLGFASCVAAWHDWARVAGKRGVVELRRGQLVIPSDLGTNPGRCSIPARLRSGAPWSVAVPMELELIPWPEVFATTWLALCPRRRVHLSGRYFRAGHALLDQVTAGLVLHAD
jgi:hypothetical protein